MGCHCKASWLTPSSTLGGTCVISPGCCAPLSSPFTRVACVVSQSIDFSDEVLSLMREELAPFVDKEVGRGALDEGFLDALLEVRPCSAVRAPMPRVTAGMPA